MLKWAIAIEQNNKEYYCKKRGKSFGSFEWTDNKEHAMKWSSKGGAEYYHIKNLSKGYIVKIEK